MGTEPFRRRVLADVPDYGPTEVTFARENGPHHLSSLPLTVFEHHRANVFVDICKSHS
jgi:hypothetical protein